MALSEIVSVTIQAGTVTPERAGFGVPLIMAWHNAFGSDEVRSYTTFAGLAADFSASNADQRQVYEIAQAIFSQSPRPGTVKVAAPSAAGAPQEYTLDFTNHTSGSAITGTITHADGTTFAINVPWNTSIALTLADFETAVEAAGDYIVDDTGSPVATVAETNNGRNFEIEITSSGCEILETTAARNYDTHLTAAAVIDPEFYAVITDTGSPLNLEEVAPWASSNGRLFGASVMCTDPADFVAGEFSSGADLTALQANDDAFAVFTKTANGRQAAAWFGRMLPTDPGSATWAYKQLASIGVDTLTATERSSYETLGGNHYTEEAAVAVTRPGKAWGGEWIDVTRGLAWLEARIQEGQFTVLANAPKVPYTDAGIALLAADLTRVLRIAEDRNVIAPGWTVTIPTAASQDTADRAARIVRDIEFQASLAGAIHTINIVGTVTV